MERCFKKHYLGVRDDEMLAQTVSRCVQIRDGQYAEDHAGYIAHGHGRPWDVQRKGFFMKLEPMEWHQLFLNWQDLVHKRLHIKGVEQDCEKLRSGNGGLLVANDAEMAARDIEDLIAAGILLTDGIGMVKCNSREVGQALYQNRKMSGITFPRMRREQQTIVLNIVASRCTAKISENPQKAHYQMSDIDCVPPAIQE